MLGPFSEKKEVYQISLKSFTATHASQLLSQAQAIWNQGYELKSFEYLSFQNQARFFNLHTIQSIADLSPSKRLEHYLNMINQIKALFPREYVIDNVTPMTSSFPISTGKSWNLTANSEPWRIPLLSGLSLQEVLDDYDFVNYCTCNSISWWSEEESNEVSNQANPENETYLTIPNEEPTSDMSPSISPPFLSPRLSPSVSRPPVSPPISPPVSPSVSPPVSPSVSPSVSPPVSPPISPPVSPSVSPPQSPPISPHSPPISPLHSPPISPPQTPPHSPHMSPSHPTFIPHIPTVPIDPPLFFFQLEYSDDSDNFPIHYTREPLSISLDCTKHQVFGVSDSSEEEFISPVDSDELEEKKKEVDHVFQYTQDQQQVPEVEAAVKQVIEQQEREWIEEEPTVEEVFPSVIREFSMTMQSTSSRRRLVHGDENIDVKANCWRQCVEEGLNICVNSILKVSQSPAMLQNSVRSLNESVFSLDVKSTNVWRMEEEELPGDAEAFAEDLGDVGEGKDSCVC